MNKWRGICRGFHHCRWRHDEEILRLRSTSTPGQVSQSASIIPEGDESGSIATHLPTVQLVMKNVQLDKYDETPHITSEHLLGRRLCAVPDTESEDLYDSMHQFSLRFAIQKVIQRWLKRWRTWQEIYHLPRLGRTAMETETNSKYNDLEGGEPESNHRSTESRASLTRRMNHSRLVMMMDRSISSETIREGKETNVLCH